jgi:selenocysteine lyase/cysteine desulfurase
MYAYRLCVAAGIDIDLGVTRVSMSHYNSLDEIELLIKVLDPII